MGTERVSPRYAEIDSWGASDALEALIEGQFGAVAAVRAARSSIEAAAQAMEARLRFRGRIIYAGAGTSGRLAVQIARHLGARKVIATGRNPEALQALEAMGADHTVQLTGDDDLTENTFRRYFSEGIDVVLDYLWGRSAELLMIAAAAAVALAACQSTPEKPLRANAQLQPTKGSKTFGEATF